MKKYIYLLTLISILVVLIGAQCTPASQSDQADNASVEISAEGLVNERCSTCHGVGVVRATNRSEQDWIKLVDRMISKGAKLDENERDMVINYLVENYKD